MTYGIIRIQGEIDLIRPDAGWSDLIMRSGGHSADTDLDAAGIDISWSGGSEIAEESR